MLNEEKNKNIELIGENERKNHELFVHESVYFKNCRSFELKILRDGIDKILCMEKSEKTKAEKIWSAAAFFQRKLLSEVNKIESKIVDLQERFVSANDDELQEIDDQMKALLAGLFEIYEEKNKIEKITQSIPAKIWEQVREIEKQRMMKSKDLREEMLNFDEDLVDAHRCIEILETLNMIDPAQLKYVIDEFSADLDGFEDATPEDEI